MKNIGSLLIALFVTTSAVTVCAGTETRKVTVESVKGLAHYMAPDGWQPLEKGQELDEKTVVLTGFSGEVVLHFRDDTRVTVKEATRAGIRTFHDAREITTTRIDLDHGGIRVKVDSSMAPNDFRVNVHGTVLAVTGTGGDISWWPDSGMFLFSWEHTWAVTNHRGSRDVEESTATNDELAPPDIIMGGALDTRQGDLFGLTGDEISGLRRLNTGRGVFTVVGDDPTRVPVRGGSVRGGNRITQGG